MAYSVSGEVPKVREVRLVNESPDFSPGCMPMVASVVRKRKIRKLSRSVAAKHRSRSRVVKSGRNRRDLARRAGWQPQPPGEEFPGKDSRADAQSRAQSNHFNEQRGRLPWPVDSRTVSVHFGYYSYLPNVTGNSRGITIEVECGTSVKAVCDGEVESVMDLGDAKAVLLRHGNFYTVYSNLPDVDVTKGDLVKEGQVLGRITSAGQLDFYIYYVNDNWFFDPEKWLKR